MPEPTVEEIIRSLIRDEIAQGGTAPRPSAPPPWTGREVAVIVLFVLSVGLLLALLPNVEDNAKTMWSLLVSITGTSMAVVYTWLRTHHHSAINRPITLATVMLMLAILAATHTARNVDIVPIVVEPEGAWAIVGGKSESPKKSADSNRAVIKVEAKKQTVVVTPDLTSPPEHQRTVQVTALGGILAVVRRRPIEPLPLLCPMKIETSADDGEMAIDVRHCNPSKPGACELVPFDSDYVVRARNRPEVYWPVKDPKVGGDTVAFRGEGLALGIVPAGFYEVTVRKTPMCADSRRHMLKARSCERIQFNELKC